MTTILALIGGVVIAAAFWLGLIFVAGIFGWFAEKFLEHFFRD